MFEKCIGELLEISWQYLYIYININTLYRSTGKIFKCTLTIFATSFLSKLNTLSISDFCAYNDIHKCKTQLCLKFKSLGKKW